VPAELRSRLPRRRTRAVDAPIPITARLRCNSRRGAPRPSCGSPSIDHRTLSPPPMRSRQATRWGQTGDGPRLPRCLAEGSEQQRARCRPRRPSGL
jgi:hypothetical protein